MCTVRVYGKIHPADQKRHISVNPHTPVEADATEEHAFRGLLLYLQG